MKLFVTGATGYIGGDALYAIANAHPEYEITALVRNTEKGALIASQYPKVRLVYGDLDSAELLEKEAREADIVCHWADADHEAGANALIRGLKLRFTTVPSFLIHTSGTGILLFSDIERQTFGEASTKIYDDWDNVQEMFTGLPDTAFHRNVDKAVQTAGLNTHVKTAIVCPPVIYGEGRGPGNQTSIQVPTLAKVTIEKGHGVQVGPGKTFWTAIHVHDLSQLYLRLVEAAAAGGEPATWGEGGYYFCQSEEIAWGAVAHQVAHSAYKQGLIKEDKVVEYSGVEIKDVVSFGAALWGANSRCRAIRAGKLLGWKAKSLSLKDEIDNAVKIEAKKLGAIPGHAKVAAGDA